MPLDPVALAGHWVHSREEDSPSTLVYRPKSYAFPPARGRKALELAASGEYVEHGYGPTDRRTQSGAGRFRLDGDELVLTSRDGDERRLRVVEFGKGRLVLAKA